MPCALAAPCPHAVAGKPSGCSALNAAAPALLFADSAASASCGSLLPDSQPSRVDNASTKPATSGRSGEPGGSVVAIASATLLPICGLPIEVIDATRSGRTDAT